jgi:hypothetical protein
MPSATNLISFLRSAVESHRSGMPPLKFAREVLWRLKWNSMHASPDRCLSTGMGRSPLNPGSLFYVLRYPSRQRESKCVLAQGALSLVLKRTHSIRGLPGFDTRVLNLVHRGDPERHESKFGLRHGIKLIELYAMTKSEFLFSMIRLRKSNHNVRDPDSVPPVYSFSPNYLVTLTK